MEFKFPSNLAELFHNSVAREGDKTLYMSKRNDKYRSLSYNQVGEIVRNMALGLSSLGITKNDKVAILCPTQEEWAMADFAILTLGAVTTPIYPSLPSNQVEFILKNSDSKIVFVSDSEQLKKISEVKNNCPMLTHVVLISGVDNQSGYVVTMDELQAKGRSSGKSADFLKDTMSKIKPNELATIIYTSGTTGLPKGVMLSHDNLISNCTAASKVCPINNNDVLLSFLPLAHVFERMAGHFLAVMMGAQIAYAENMESIPKNMGEINPTVMVAVPRLYEKMFDRIKDGLAHAPKIRRKLFGWALGVGKEAWETKKKGFAYTVANKLVFSKLHARLGGRIRIMVSGGAPLAKEIAELFGYMGVMILEGYGLTETSPLITVNRPEMIKFGTVGPVAERIEVKIASDGEILARGPNVMLGYYKNEAATKEVIDAEGWFHTGDIGHFDSEKRIVITDRKKNIIVTSGGKNVAPQPIEQALVTIPYIEQALVIGDNRNFISALIVPRLERLRDHAKENNIPYDGDEELLANKVIYDLVDKAIQDAQDQAGFAKYERVRKFVFLPSAFSIESGTMTPSLKIKRNVVTMNFKTIIDTLYNRETEKANESGSMV